MQVHEIVVSGGPRVVSSVRSSFEKQVLVVAASSVEETETDPSAR